MRGTGGGEGPPSLALFPGVADNHVDRVAWGERVKVLEGGGVKVLEGEGVKMWGGEGEGG